MSVERRTTFLAGGGWLHETSDYSNEVTLETSFFTHLLSPSKESVKFVPSRGEMESLKSENKVKTLLTFTDMSLFHNLQEVEMDATVPVFKEPATFMDLSGQLTPTLEVLSSLETLGPGGPLGLLGGATFPSAEVVTKVLIQDQDPCLASSSNHLTNLDVNETFQDLNDLLQKDCLSPAASTCTTAETVYSPASLSSGVSSPAHFFDTTPSNEEYRFPSSSSVFESKQTDTYEFKREEYCVSPSYACSSKDNRYSEMRKKNNIASKRSRQTRREKEIENEQRVKELEIDNDVLRAKVRKLEELTKNVKAYLIKSVSQKK